MLRRKQPKRRSRRASPPISQLVGSPYYRNLGLDHLEDRALLAGTPGLLVPHALGGTDLGDAPDTYGTLLASDGARHTTTTLFLGASSDDELDAAAPLDGTGDDADATDDENGVTVSPMAPGGFARATVIASAVGQLDAWIDFNADGEFEPVEKIASSAALTTGVNFIDFIVPIDAEPTPTFGRFRVSIAGGLGPTGAAPNGEGEDYSLSVAPPLTTYVSPDFAGLNPGDDPPGPATAFGYDAFLDVGRARSALAQNSRVQIVGFGDAIVTPAEPGSFETIGAQYDVYVDTSVFDNGEGIIGDDGVGDDIEARLNATGTLLEILVNGSLAFTFPYSSDTELSPVNTLELVGSSDDDAFTITEVNNRLPCFPGTLVGRSQSGTAHVNASSLASGVLPQSIGVHFDAGGDVLPAVDDVFAVAMTSSHNVSYFSDDLTAPNSGVVNVAGEYTLTFSDLTPLVMNGAGGTLTVDATSTPATTALTISDFGPALDGFSQIAGDGGFETTVFAGYSALVVRGGDGSETITLEDVDPADPDGVGPGTALTSVEITGDNTTGTDAADDVLNAERLPMSVSLTLGGGNGNDTFNLGSDSANPGLSTLDFLLGPISVIGGDHNATPTTTLVCDTASNTLAVGDTLNVNDQGNAFTAHYNVSELVLFRTAATAATINYFQVETFVINTGSNDDQLSLVDNSQTNLTLNLGSGNDQVMVPNVGTASNVTLNGNGDDDEFEIHRAGTGSVVLINGELGNDTTTLGRIFARLDFIVGAVCADGGDGNDILLLDDSGAPAGREYVTDEDTVQRGDGTRVVEYINQEELTLQAGGQGDIIRVQQTNAATPVVVLGGAGNDEVHVGSGPFSGTRTLDGIRSLVTVDGEADSDRLFVDDQGDTDDNHYLIMALAVTRSAGGEQINYFQTELLTLNAGRGDDFIGVLSTGASTVLNAGDGDDDLEVAVTGTLDQIAHDVTVDGGADSLGDSLFVNDALDIEANTYFLSTGNVRRTGAGPTVNIVHSAIEVLTLEAGIGDDQINVQSTGSTDTFVEAGPGNDTINVSSTAPGGNGNLDGITARLVIDAETDIPVLLMLSTQTVTRNQSLLPPPDGLGPCPVIYASTFSPANENVLLGDTLNISDEGLAARALYTVDAINLGTPEATQRVRRTSQAGGPAVSTAQIEYMNMERLELITSSAAGDQVNVQLPTQPTSPTNPPLPATMSFDGGGGADDFLTITGTADADTINVGSAGIAARSQIELARMELFKFIAGGGDDLLAARNLGPGTETWMQGQAGNDLLVGGAGSDTFEGGIGNDIAFGNEGEDLLVGGAGEDELRGWLGDDVLFGGAGYDALFGDQDNDYLFADQDVPVVDFHDYSLAYSEAILGCEFTDGGAGVDTVVALGNLDQIDNAERFVDTGATKNVFTWLRGSSFTLNQIALFIAQARVSLNN